VKKSIKRWSRVVLIVASVWFTTASVWLAGSRSAGVQQAELPATSSVEFSLRFKLESAPQPAPSVRKAAPTKNEKAKSARHSCPRRESGKKNR